MENPKLVVVYAPEGALEIINRATRTAYRSHDKEKPGTREAFVQNIIKSGHESVIEHVSVNFELSNISRACATQILRHRLASYTCESMRYVTMDPFEYVVPAGVENSVEAMKLFEKAVTSASTAYSKLIALGVKKEDARACLPIATKTRMFFTYNLREVRHFLHERLSPRAQREVRMVAVSMYDQLSDLYPWLLSDMEEAYEKAVKSLEDK